MTQYIFENLVLVFSLRVYQRTFLSPPDQERSLTCCFHILRERMHACMNISSEQVAVRLVADFTEYPHNFLPDTVQRSTEILGLTEDGRWEQSGQGWHSLVSPYVLQYSSMCCGRFFHRLQLQYVAPPPACDACVTSNGRLLAHCCVVITVIKQQRTQVYKPIVHVDEIGLTSDKYVPLNKTLSSLPLKVTIEPMSMQRWQLMQVCLCAFHTAACVAEPRCVCLRVFRVCGRVRVLFCSFRVCVRGNDLARRTDRMGALRELYTTCLSCQTR